MQYMRKIPVLFQKRNFSRYNFFVSLRKGAETILKNDIKYVYLKELIECEKRRLAFASKENDDKKKYLFKLKKIDGGIHLRCSCSLIYLLCLKCHYIENIWLNIAKNKICESLSCLENILLNICWEEYIQYDDLINIPIKVICKNSRLFNTAAIKNAVHISLHNVIFKRNNELLKENVEVKKIKKETNEILKENVEVQKIKKETNKILKENAEVKKPKKETNENRCDEFKNIWNTLSVHIENNVCNIDIKFSGNLSPRFYEYKNMDELEKIKNIDQYVDINFYSLFNREYVINDKKIKRIIKQSVPYWSIFEEIKKVRVENTDKSIHNYNDNTENVHKEKSNNTNENAEYVRVDCEIDTSKKLQEKGNMHAYSLFAQRQMQNNNPCEKETETDTEKGKEKEKKKQNILNANEYEENHLSLKKMKNYLTDMEIMRMKFYNNSYFMSDDSYDSSNCTYALLIHKCFKMQRDVDKIKIIWDPFCSKGILIFELLFYFLEIPLYNENEILPFMNLKIFDQEEFKSIYTHVLNHLNTRFCKLEFVGSDNRSIMIAQCKKNLVRYILYYSDIIKRLREIKQNGKGTEYTEVRDTQGKKYVLNRNSFLEGVLMKEDEVKGQKEKQKNYVKDVVHFNYDNNDEKEKVFWYDLDNLYNQRKKKEKGKTPEKKERQTHTHKKKKYIGIENRYQRQNRNIEMPDIETLSLSTEEDKMYNSNFPFNVSFHKTHFFHMAPFIHNATIITKLPHFSFSKELGMNKKIFTLYEQFDQMLCSRNDWRGVYVLVRGKAFLNKSKLEWNKLLVIKDSKGRCLTLLSWTGRKKCFYSLTTEEDKLKELEQFNEALNENAL